MIEETKYIILLIPEIKYWYEFFGEYNRRLPLTQHLLSSEEVFNHRTEAKVKNSVLTQEFVQVWWFEAKYRRPLRSTPVCMWEACVALDELGLQLHHFKDMIASKYMSASYNAICRCLSKVSICVERVEKAVTKVELHKQDAWRWDLTTGLDSKIRQSILKPYVAPSDVISPVRIAREGERWYLQYLTSGKVSETDTDNTPRWEDVGDYDLPSQESLSGQLPYSIWGFTREKLIRRMIYRRKQRQDKMKLNLFPKLPDPVAQLILEFAGHAREGDLCKKT